MIGEPTDARGRVIASWVVVVLAVGFHVWGLYTTSPPEVGAWAFPGVDKVGHVILFAVPAWALLRVVPNPWLALVPLLAHIPVSELVQANVLPGREGDPWDAVADLVGVAAGWWTHRSGDRAEAAS